MFALRRPASLARALMRHDGLDVPEAVGHQQVADPGGIMAQGD